MAKRNAPSRAASEGPASVTRRSTRSQSRELGSNVEPIKPIEHGDLETVPEELGGTIGILNDVDGTSDAGHGEHRRLASMDGFSQATRNTSFSQDELRNLDALNILGELVILHQTTANILDAVVPLGATLEKIARNATDLTNPKSSLRRSLSSRLQAFGVLKASFGHRSFIDPSIILRVLLHVPKDEELVSAVWRPDDIFYLTNLVSFLQALFSNADEEEVLETLETLDKGFPDLALSSLNDAGEFGNVVGESNLVNETQGVALELRTQLYIRALQFESAAEDAAPDLAMSTLSKIFLANSDDDRDGLPYNLTVEDLKAWGQVLAADDQVNFDAKTMDRIEDIRQGIDNCGGNAEATYNYLTARFPWDRYCTTCLEWAQERYRELKNLIEARGGVERIVKKLTEEVEDTSQDAHTTATSLASKKAIQALRARRERIAGQAPPSAMPDPNDDPPDSIGPADVANDDDDDDDDELIFVRQDRDDEVAPNDPVQDHIARIRALGNAGAGKENRRFIDQQNGARRVEFDSQDSRPTHHDPASSNLTPRMTLRNKRAEPHDDDDDDEEDEVLTPTQDAFQNDPRQHAAPQRAAQRAQTSRTAPSPSRRNVLPRTSIAHDISDEQPNLGERQNPGQRIDPVDIEFFNEDGTSRSITEGDRYRQAKLGAKLLAAQNRKPQQSRRRWTPDEEDRLIYLIGNHGAAYSILKSVDRSDGNILSLRSAEDLRHKARNIKTDLLKAGVELLDGFDQVLLGKKEIESIHKAGKSYSQHMVRTVQGRE